MVLHGVGGSKPIKALEKNRGIGDHKPGKNKAENGLTQKYILKPTTKDRPALDKQVPFLLFYFLSDGISALAAPSSVALFSTEFEDIKVGITRQTGKFRAEIVQVSFQVYHLETVTMRMKTIAMVMNIRNSIMQIKYENKYKTMQT